MNIALELHDSEVGACRSRDQDLCIAFSAAYVHHSEGAPGVDSGSGYVQALEMLLQQASWSGSLPSCLGRLSDGRISAGGQHLQLVPLPCDLNGPVRLELTFQNGEALAVTAARMTVRFTGEPRFVESFKC
jgi:hypothetical protein